jgi:hypothetical protein
MRHVSRAARRLDGDRGAPGSISGLTMVFISHGFVTSVAFSRRRCLF